MSVSAASLKPGQQLSDLVRSGGRVSVVATTDGYRTASSDGAAGGLTSSDRELLRGLTGVAFASNGEPDFEGARASGGEVEGAIPGGYQYSFINDGMGNEVHFFAAKVTADRKTGALTGDISPHYLKGMMLQLGTSGSDSNRRDFVQMAMNYLDKLPGNATEARARANDRTFEITA